jgi:hypothetical protein
MRAGESPVCAVDYVTRGIRKDVQASVVREPTTYRLFTIRQSVSWSRVGRYQVLHVEVPGRNAHSLT